MKRIYLMQRHAEKQAALTRAQREKEAKDRLREQATEAAAQRARAERQLQEALAEVPPTPLLKTMHGRTNCHQQCQLSMALSRSPVTARSNILRASVHQLTRNVSSQLRFVEVSSSAGALCLLGEEGLGAIA